jgi:GMP synthase (glutamine-hydrolysing)
MYRGKPDRFDALTSHADHVVALGPVVRCLASNDWSPVQAVGNDTPRAPFWAVQYHPEYDLHEVASLARLRKQELVAQKTFRDVDAADRYIADLEALHAEPSREDLKQRLGIGAGVLDVAIRTLEVRNWLASLHPIGSDIA